MLNTAILMGRLTATLSFVILPAMCCYQLYFGC